MTLSTHKTEVVSVKLEKHPNADTLSIVKVFGYQVCVRTADWKDGDLGAYVVPDSLVPIAQAEFCFLADGKSNQVRIKAKKLRGIISYGLLVHAPAEAKEGDNVSEQLGVQRYESPIKLSTGGQSGLMPKETKPDIPQVIYDVESLQRYPHIFELNESVHCTEKIHGANSRYVWHDGKMFVGSHTSWYKEHESLVWWVVLKRHPEIEEFCRENPDHILYGEVYGWVQSLRYGRKSGEVDFAAFDIMHNGSFFDDDKFRDAVNAYDVGVVPYVRTCPYNFEDIFLLAEGNSLIQGADHIREGIVIKPSVERWNQEIGRVQLKLVSATYLEKNTR